MKWFKNKKSCDSLVYNAGWNAALYKTKEFLVQVSNTKKDKKDMELAMSTIISALKR